MIKANHNKYYKWFFNGYFNFILKRNFNEIKLITKIELTKRPILLIPNHFSWWDGFFAWYVNEQLFHRKFHLMMLEKELAKNKYFSKIGAFSIQKNTRNIIESIQYASQILRDPVNLLVFFPQGKLFSNHVSPIKFEKGIERVISNSTNLQIIFMVNLVDYYASKKPSLSINLKEYPIETFDFINFQEAYNTFYKVCIDNQDKIFKQ